MARGMAVSVVFQFVSGPSSQAPGPFGFVWAYRPSVVCASSRVVPTPQRQANATAAPNRNRVDSRERAGIARRLLPALARVKRAVMTVHRVD
jgi:hypothetical protein